MVAAVLLLLYSCSATDSNPCLELNSGSLNRSACEALSAGFTSVDCCGAALDPYTLPPPRVATASRSCVRSIGLGGTHRFYLLSVAILLQASPSHPPLLLAWEPIPARGACTPLLFPSRTAGWQAVVWARARAPPSHALGSHCQATHQTHRGHSKGWSTRARTTSWPSSQSYSVRRQEQSRGRAARVVRRRAGRTGDAWPHLNLGRACHHGPVEARLQRPLSQYL